jgi:hypothetical protein
MVREKEDIMGYLTRTVLQILNRFVYADFPLSWY